MARANKFQRIFMITLVPVWVSVGCDSTGHLGTSAFPKMLSCHGVELVLIPQGERIIGTNNSRVPPWERPACVFRLDYVLYMSRREITAGMYRAVIPTDSLGEPTQPNRPEDHPACVIWEEADKFCREFQKILEERTGCKWICRLPREAEWEYAARYGRPHNEDWWPETLGPIYGDVNSPYFYDLLEHAWYNENSNGKPHPVGLKKPNPLGLYDMLGNEAEWCDGWWTDSVKAMLTDGWRKDYPGFPGHMKAHIARGGYYDSDHDECRPSRRRVTGAPYGFRIVALPQE